jgi:hypothetical protein
VHVCASDTTVLVDNDIVRHAFPVVAVVRETALLAVATCRTDARTTADPDDDADWDDQADMIELQEDLPLRIIHDDIVLDFGVVVCYRRRRLYVCMWRPSSCNEQQQQHQQDTTVLYNSYYTHAAATPLRASVSDFL